jgi:hypothetical protein
VDVARHCVSISALAGRHFFLLQQLPSEPTYYHPRLAIQVNLLHVKNCLPRKRGKSKYRERRTASLRRIEPFQHSPELLHIPAIEAGDSNQLSIMATKSGRRDGNRRIDADDSPAVPLPYFSPSVR